jgi:hypothetical protein
MAGTLYPDDPGWGCHEYTKIFVEICRNATAPRRRGATPIGPGIAVPVPAAGGGSGWQADG